VKPDLGPPQRKGLRQPEGGADGVDRLAHPVGVVVRGHERPCVHTVDVQDPVQVVDLVLENAGVPPGAQRLVALALGIEPADPHRVGPLHQAAVTFDTQAPAKNVRVSSPTRSISGLIHRRVESSCQPTMAEPPSPRCLAAAALTPTMGGDVVTAREAQLHR